MRFVGTNSHEVYAAVVAAVMTKGCTRIRTPRGIHTRELGFTEIVVTTPHQMLPLGTRPGLSTPLAALEATQLVGGFSDPELVQRVAKPLTDYIEPNGQFWGAYGLRIRDQVQHVVDKIKNDPDTRQAVITLWNPSLDNQPGKRDYPCTTSLVFETLDNELHLTVQMRSNDIWKGLPYDLFQFHQLHCTVSHALQMPTGVYRHTAVSMHAYESDLEKLDQVSITNARSGDFQPHGFGYESGETWRSCMNRAHVAAYGENPRLCGFTHSELWHALRLAYPNDPTKWNLNE